MNKQIRTRLCMPRASRSEKSTRRWAEEERPLSGEQQEQLAKLNTVEFLEKVLR